MVIATRNEQFFSLVKRQLLIYFEGLNLEINSQAITYFGTLHCIVWPTFAPNAVYYIPEGANKRGGHNYTQKKSHSKGSNTPADKHKFLQYQTNYT